MTLHVNNRIQYSNYTMKDVLSSPDNHYYEWRFGKIRYSKKGSGTPLLLLHDLTVGSSAYEFHKVLDSLAEKHEVYALDFLGYGLSDKPNMTYTNYLYVQLVNDFIKNIIGKKADIIATGDAAPVAVMVCHNDPDVINKKFDPADITAYVEACHRQDYRSKYAFTSYLGRYLNANIIHAVKEINHSIYILAGKEKPDNDTIVENYEYYNSSIESVLFQRFTRRETCFTRIFPRRVFFLLDNQKIPVNIGIR